MASSVGRHTTIVTSLVLALDEPALVPAWRSEVIEAKGKNGVRGCIDVLADRTALHTPGFCCALD
jgi:hypothetical protein